MSIRGLSIRTKEDMVQLVDRLGFLPFFPNSVPGFSVEEMADPSIWFHGVEGPWEWKGPVIRATGCVYGKFFEKKAGFISREWFPDFANFRRDGYDFDARYDDGLASHRDKELFELLDENAPIHTKLLRDKGDYRKGGKKGFETLITRLQFQCYAVVNDFLYLKDKNDKPYGWGVAEYSTPEKVLGADFTDAVYVRKPEESYQRVFEYLNRLLPDAGEAAIKKLLK